MVNAIDGALAFLRVKEEFERKQLNISNEVALKIIELLDLENPNHQDEIKRMIDVAIMLNEYWVFASNETWKIDDETPKLSWIRWGDLIGHKPYVTRLTKVLSKLAFAGNEPVWSHRHTDTRVIPISTLWDLVRFIQHPNWLSKFLVTSNSGPWTLAILHYALSKIDWIPEEVLISINEKLQATANFRNAQQTFLKKVNW